MKTDAVGAVVVMVGAALIVVSCFEGHFSGREWLCEKQFKGVMVEGSCVARGSLKPVAP